MIEMTYDPKADAAYITLSRGEIADTEEAGPFIYDIDGEGKILGIEILSCGAMLAGTEWHRKATLIGGHPEAAE